MIETENMSNLKNLVGNFDLKIKEYYIKELDSLGVNPINQRECEEAKVNKNLFTYSNPYDEHLKGDGGKRLRTEEQTIIAETREEVQRSKGFKLIYPSYNCCMYKQYLEIDRPFNAILRNEYFIFFFQIIFIKNIFQDSKEFAKSQKRIIKISRTNVIYLLTN